MAVYLVPGVFGAGGQIFGTSGSPAGGALINTYAAGTSSPVATFTTSAGNVTAANPVVAGANGRLPHEMWQTEGQAIRIVLTDSLAVSLDAYDNLHGINDPAFVGGAVFTSTVNTFTAQQNFSGITASSILVTSLFASTIQVSNFNVSNLAISTLTGVTITVSTINVSTINASTINVSTISVSTLTVNSSATVSNLTVSGTATFNSLSIGRITTGIITNTIAAGALVTANVLHRMVTDNVFTAITVSPSVNQNWMVVVTRPDGCNTAFRGVSNTNVSNSPPGSPATGTVNIQTNNNHTATQYIVVNYMILG